jgi:hypothetical protein
MPLINADVYIADMTIVSMTIASSRAIGLQVTNTAYQSERPLHSP